MKPTTLRGRKVNQKLLRHGKRWRGKTMTITYAFGHPTSGVLSDTNVQTEVVYVGSFAPVHLHKNAVVRNKMRRRCKEALRVTLRSQQKMPTVQLLIAPKSSSLDSDYSLILEDVESFIQFLTLHDPSPT